MDTNTEIAVLGSGKSDDSTQQEALEQVVYMFYGDDLSPEDGPYIGAAGLDFKALAAEYRAERFAECEAAEDDYCFINSSGIYGWLCRKGVLAPLKTVTAMITIDTDGENAYVPKHWPICPECGEGRGQDDAGPVRHELNRREWYKKCTGCGHTWDRHDEPYDSKNPMQDDDGRCIPAGCVPYAISQVGGLPIAQVIRACEQRGWREGGGMDAEGGLVVAKQLGLTVVEGKATSVCGKLTLRKLFDTISRSKNYIVSTKDHWLAVVEGENRDQNYTHMRTEVLAYWEVRRESMA